MNRFSRLVEIVLSHEGGYVNNPDDPGGETNFGISRRQYPDLDIENLTKAEAKEIYYLDYWSEYMAQIISERVALLLFDFGVNAGVHRATRIIQQLVNVTNDGILGRKTVSAINSHNQTRMVRDFAVQIAMYYVSLDEKMFLKGWMRRLMDNMSRTL